MNKLELKCGERVLFSVDVNRLPASKEELRALFIEIVRSIPDDPVVDVESEIVEKDTGQEVENVVDTEYEETDPCTEPTVATDKC